MSSVACRAAGALFVSYRTHAGYDVSLLEQYNSKILVRGPVGMLTVVTHLPYISWSCVNDDSTCWGSRAPSLLPNDCPYQTLALCACHRCAV